MPTTSTRIRSDNKIANSPFYGEVVTKYNELIRAEGKISKKKFYEEFVKPKIQVSERTWYNFLDKLEATAGVVDAIREGREKETIIAPLAPPAEVGKLEIEEAKAGIVMRLADNATATRNLISNMLNIGADAAQELIDHPEKLSPEKRVDMALKAMRAQDSRIFAVAAVKKDKREEKAFQASFNDAAYQEGIFEDEVPVV